MTSDNTANDGGQKPPSGGEGVKRIRRKPTDAEKAASLEKRLRDQYGNSRLDPDEPPLHGLTAAAILCALELLRRAYRNSDDFKPKIIADKVASICSLSADQHKLLNRWLAWAKPRRWVLQEEMRSPVVAWSIARPKNAEIWTMALDKQWRIKIQDWAPKEEAKKPSKEPAPSSSEPREADPASAAKSSHSGEAPSRSDPKPQADVAAPASRDPVDRSDAIFRSEPSPSSGGQQAPPASLPIERKCSAPRQTTELINRLKPVGFPKPGFKEPWGGAANGFADAALKFLRSQGSLEVLRIAADGLRKDVFECREFCQRSPEHRKFVEIIFEEFGWEVP